ncbi:MAG: aldehyde ferredoxin oxidoreductase family protein [Desulfohalobiaceae bacterium]|nr:aldehyde ferredoxin oxidoreductase family protein [Desulfohalobiaceae bacterium]
MSGYMGKILHVDLTNKTTSVESPSDEFYRKHMGGSCLNLYYILKEMQPGLDAFDPGNILAISPGVTTGFAVSGQSRVTINAKSPLTGAIGDSQSGGFWPSELKFAGFDAVIVKGRAQSPVYLWIHDGEAEIKKADHLWGKFTGDAEQLIKEELGDEKCKILQIGPGGEKLVRFAAVLSMCNRANGRTGMGAVMGSKNLKAVVVRGKQRPQAADQATVKELAKTGGITYPKSMVAGMDKYGTASAVLGMQAAGGLPSYNFTSGVFDQAQNLDGTTMAKSILKGSDSGKQDKLGADTCFGCVVKCKRVVEINHGPHPVDPVYGGPEYETVATFGSYCGIDDLPAVAKANELCNKYGLDTISCGATIAWAMETFEAGELTPEDTGGLDLRYGNAEAMLELTQLIGKRQGFGKILSEGSARAARHLGKGERFLITCKDQESPAHMPQHKRSMALIYAVNPFGADHQSSEHDTEYEPETFEHFSGRLAHLGLREPQPVDALNPAKVAYTRRTQQLMSLLDSLNLCQFVWGSTWQLFGPEEILSFVRAATGWEVDLEELLEVGERRLNMMRVFNAREGISANQDRLPEKFFNTPLKGGISDGWKVDKPEFEEALHEYYRQCGWDEQSGVPTPETLKRLGLGWSL